VKLPRDVSGADAVRALQRLGFVVVRQRGSHIRLGKGPLGVTVPAHGSIAPGTLQSILRQAGVSVEVFVEALR
jgi:predicted RNA binding protein YcfA (HicA-like mRNA interferase family)